MGRQPCCDKSGMKRGPWTVEEDQKLISFILNHGIQCWRLVPKLAGLMRCGKSCRLRWINYLRPDLKRGVLSEAEEEQIIKLQSRLGNRWSKIASYFPGRTDNEIKNHWNTRIKKKLKHVGLDSTTLEPAEQEWNSGSEIEEKGLEINSLIVAEEMIQTNNMEMKPTVQGNASASCSATASVSMNEGFRGANSADFGDSIALGAYNEAQHCLGTDTSDCFPPSVGTPYCMDDFLYFANCCTWP